jgi:hypothetical protein
MESKETRVRKRSMTRSQLARWLLAAVAHDLTGAKDLRMATFAVAITGETGLGNCPNHHP